MYYCLDNLSVNLFFFLGCVIQLDDGEVITYS